MAAFILDQLHFEMRLMLEARVDALVKLFSTLKSWA